jgi:hypothetical protein
MADAVSKLYAEIGFKVNKDGLKQAQSLLKDMAKQMSAINNATKEAAKQYGIFSKERSKQAVADSKLAINNEKAETQRSKRRLETKKFEHKQLMDLAKLEFQVEKYNASEKQKIEKQQTREAEKAAKNQKKRLKELLNGFRSFAVGLRNTFLSLAGVGTAGIVTGMTQSLDRSIPTRDFMMTTGVSLPELQSVMQRMVNTGSSMTQQQIMGDIQKVSQNLQDIALGGGGIVPYKLAGIAASGNVMDVIKATEQAVKGLNNAMALNLTRRIGLSDDWLASWRFKERYGGDQVQLSKEQQEEIANAKVALSQLVYGFRLLSDQITAVLSPTIEEISDVMRDSFQEFARYLKENSEEVRKKVKEVSKFITDFIKNIEWEKIWNNIKSVGVALVEFARMVHKISKLFGVSEEEKEKEPMYVSEEHWWGGKLKPLSEYQPSAVGKAVNSSLSPDTLNMISSFSSTPRRSGIIGAIDNHVTNVTINGVYQDELKDEMVNAIEEYDQKNSTYGISDRVSDINQLWVVGHSTSPSVGG